MNEAFARHFDSRSKMPFNIELRFRHRGGSTIWVHCRGQVDEWDEHDKPSRMTGCVVDISDRKRVEDALATERNNMFKKNIALQEVIASVNEERNQAKQRAHENLSLLIRPLLATLKQNKSGCDLAILEVIEKIIDNAPEQIFNGQEKARLLLGPRELQICILTKKGLSSKEIAQFFHLSERTVEKHRENIRKKLGLQGNGSNLNTVLRELNF